MVRIGHACLGLGIFTYITLTPVYGLICRDCKESSSPSACRDTLTCGPNEICYTREFITQSGYRGFRMGCEDRSTCDLLLKAKTVFGKRDASQVNPSPSEKCYQCCSTPECNSALCQGSAGPVSTAFPPRNSSGCPANFIGFKDYCYLFGMGATSQQKAQYYCRKLGAYLLAFNSQEEHEFVRLMLISYNATYMVGFWTGAVFDHKVGKWAWLDGSPFTYMIPSLPPYHDHIDYTGFMLNPPHDMNYPPYRNAVIKENDNYNYGVICRKRRIL